MSEDSPNPKNAEFRVGDLGQLAFEPSGHSRSRRIDAPVRRGQTGTQRRYSKVMLLSPPAVLFRGDLPRCTYPLGLGYIAACLEANGYEVRILDCLLEGYSHSEAVDSEGNFIRYGLSEHDIRERLSQFQPDVVGVSSIFSNQADQVHRLCALAREVAQDTVVCVGGAHARYFPEMILSDVAIDYVFLGESEFVFLGFLEVLNTDGDMASVPSMAFRASNQVVISKDNPLISGLKRNARNEIAELDVIPFPAFHLYNMERYFELGAYQSPYTKGDRVAQILTSRGCSAKCTFCTTTNFWGNRLRRRSPSNVRDELKLLIEKYRINEFHIQDDNLTNDMDHARQMIAMFSEIGLPWATPQGLALWRLDQDLIDRMADSGAYQLTFAIESGVQRVLDQLIRKPLDLSRTRDLIGYARSRGLQVHGFFIIGMPPMFGYAGETIDEMHETFNFAVESNFTSASFFTATPIVGSELLEQCRRQGFVDSDTPLYRMSYKQGLVSVPGLWSGELIAQLAVDFNRRFNSGDARETRRRWVSTQY